jgi:hypothetical protein
VAVPVDGIFANVFLVKGNVLSYVRENAAQAEALDKVCPVALLEKDGVGVGNENVAVGNKVGVTSVGVVHESVEFSFRTCGRVRNVS